jgi:dTMP kinase
VSRGVFIVVEGPEGAGKSTLAAALAARLREQGHDVVAVREPGGTPAAERAREALLDPAVHLDPNTELLFVTAARAHLVQAVIRPALEAGRVVLSDRYDLSTLAYQAAGRGIPLETVRQVNDVATGGLRPDVTLVLDVSPDEGRRRLAALGKGTDRIEREDDAFHARVRAAYRSAAGEGIVHLAPAGPGALVDAAWAALCSARPGVFGPRQG